MTNKTTIRLGQLKDCKTLSRFNITMAEETENKKLNPDTVYKGVENLINQPEKGFYVIVETSKKVIGSLMITAEWSDWRNGLFWWIQSVYILPEFRRTGIFTGLYQFVKDKAQKKNNVHGIRLYVDKDNKTARKTYNAMNMEKTDYRIYEEEFNQS